MAKKNVGKKKRLIDLEVDEVSLVDKPAIGETVYLTKRVEDDAVTTKKKGVKAGDANPPANVPNETDPAALLADKMEKRFDKIEKSISEVEAMLSQSLELHEMVSVHLNEMLALNLGALDAVMMMMQEAEEEDMPMEAAGEDAEAEVEQSKTSKLITEIRDSVKAVRESVQKAGAKMSRTRLQALRDIAAKLTELITSVEPVEGEAEKKTGGKKKAALVEVTKQFKDSLDSVATEVKGLVDSVDDTKKALASMDERLKGVEATAGASDAIDDDDTEGGSNADNSDSTSKSVFAGLIPVDQIQKSIRERKALNKG